MAFAQDAGGTAPAPTIQSDKDDYAPGETVTLTGSGWQADQTVHINVNDDLGKTWSRDVDVDVDANGNITDQFQLPSTFVAVYKVTATGNQSANVAATSFTDANVQVKMAGTTGTANFTWQRFDDSTTCGGTVDNSGTTSVGTSDFQNLTGGSDTDSIKITAPSPVSTRTFSSWSGDATGTTNPICVVFPSGGSKQITANYAAVPTNTAPTSASISIDSGAAWTKSTTGSVSLALSATDNVGVASYRLAETQAGLASATAVTVSPAEASFSRNNVSFTLTGSEGASKSVWLRVCDGPGLCTDTSDTIGWDKTAPKATYDNNGTPVDANFSDTTWRNTDLSKVFTASDTGGSGLASNQGLGAGGSFTLTASAESADANTPTVVSKTVTDVAGNSTTRSLSAKIDKTNPVANCATPPTAWSGSDVSINCKPTDALSGLANTADGDFNLTTNVAAGTETSTASTPSRTVADQAGNSVTAGPFTNLKVDKKAPTVVPGDVTNTTWRNSSLSQDFTASDGGSDLAANQGLGAGGSFTLTASAESANQTTPTVVSKDIKDAVGNTTTRSLSALIDLHNPNISASVTNDPASTGWYNITTGSPIVHFECSDALSGIAPTPGCPANHTITDEGANVGYSDSVSDRAGNTNSAGVSGLMNDQTAPAPPSSIDLLASSDTGANTSDNITSDTTPEFTVSAEKGSKVELFYEGTNSLVSIGSGTADPSTGVADITVPAAKALADGNYAIVAKTTDQAGNVSLVSNDASLSVKIQTNIQVDTQAPDTVIDSQPAALTNSRSASFSFHSTEVNSTFECSLDGANPSACTSAQTYSSLADGHHTFAVTATDVAGNTDASAASYGWDVDGTAPSSSHQLSALANANDWHNANVTVTLNASDGQGSGVKEIRYSINGGTPATYDPQNKPVISTEGTTTFSYHAVDNANNAESPDNSFTVKLDKTAPTGVSGTPSRQPNSYGWYNSALTVDFNGNDTLSGIANCSTAVPYNGPDSATASVSGSCTDKAGNSTQGSFSLKYDATLPVLNLNAPAEGATVNVCGGPPPTPSFTPSDVLSGIATSSDHLVTPGTATGAGPYTYTAQATDKADNPNSETRHYTVAYGAAFGGVTQPINGGLTPNDLSDDTSRFKLGSTVPVKFTLTCNGTPVNNAVAKLNVKVADNKPDPGVDEVISTAASTTGNLFRYDATAGQYIFNLSTKSGYTNPNGTPVSFTSQGTYTLSILLDDGTYRSFNIQLVK